MAQFIRLTDTDRDDSPVWINVDHILYLWSLPDSTTLVYFTGEHGNIIAAEPVDQILLIIAGANGAALAAKDGV